MKWIIKIIKKIGQSSGSGIGTTNIANGSIAKPELASIAPRDNQGSWRPFCKAPKTACKKAANIASHKATRLPVLVPSI